MTDSIAILDFGSQYAQLIARRLREAQVYCELFPWDAPAEVVMAMQPTGFILSGGPRSVYEPGAPFIQDYVLQVASADPRHLLRHAGADPRAGRAGGCIRAARVRAWRASSRWRAACWMASRRCGCLTATASRACRRDSSRWRDRRHSPLAAIGDLQRKYFGVQFHPEVRHTPHGERLLRHFAVEICGAKPEWTPRSIVEEAVGRVREQVGSGTRAGGCQRRRGFDRGGGPGAPGDRRSVGDAVSWTRACCGRANAHRWPPPCESDCTLS